jgi:7-cyano-7-deazaguanine synthase in queuosine biosynthesis
MKRTYYIHPENESGKRRVSVKIVRKKGRKTTEEYYGVAWFDKPGSWYKDHWNLHYDGVDTACGSLDECKARLAALDGFGYKDGFYTKCEVEFVETSDRY